jgi:hypothetical protein
LKRNRSLPRANESLFHAAATRLNQSHPTPPLAAISTSENGLLHGFLSVNFPDTVGVLFSSVLYCLDATIVQFSKLAGALAGVAGKELMEVGRL